MKRFAFYGRVSTEDQQDPESSKAWQLARASQLIDAHGEVAAEYFDIGQSRSLPWKRRPQASRLLEDLRRSGDRPFDAVVIGEPARAFYGQQFGLTFPTLVHYGVELWVPEVGGRVDPDSEAHDLVMSLYGGMSKGERNRIKVRVRTAMATQAATEGRYLGGRPPYGYRLADAGPHPNPAKAADGKRSHRLEPDPETAPVVRRIFADYLDGHGLRAIAEHLTTDGIALALVARRSAQPSPPALRRRLGPLRHPIDPPQPPLHRPPGVGPTTQRRRPRRPRRRRPRTPHPDALERQRPVESGQDETHPRRPRRPRHLQPRPSHHERSHPLPSPTDEADDTTVVPAARARVLRRPAAGGWRAPSTTARPTTSAASVTSTPRSPASSTRRPSTCARTRSSPPSTNGSPSSSTPTRSTPPAPSSPPPTNPTADDTRAEQARRTIAECDRKLAQHRAALEAGADPTIVAGWMSEVTAERQRADQALRSATPGDAPTPDQLRNLIEGLGDLIDVLANADPAQRSELYKRKSGCASPGIPPRRKSW